MSTTRRRSAASRKASKAGKRSEASESPGRKEKMLHARIPERLDSEIKRRAGSLGMSVSTVVRHVLLNTFNLVEDIVADSTNVALSITRDESDTSTTKNHGGEAGASPRGRILGWQEVILNLNAVCDRCNAILATGTSAAIGIREQPGAQSIICKRCLEKHLKKAGGAKT